MMRREPQCDAAIYLLYCSFAPSVHLYRADCQHSCKFNLQVSQRLSLAMKEEIISLYQNQRMKPKKSTKSLNQKDIYLRMLRKSAIVFKILNGINLNRQHKIF